MTRPKDPYGRPHRRRRAELLAALVPGTPCVACGRGMYRHQQLEADHSTPWALGGTPVADRLLHRSCNARRGQRLGAELRRQSRARGVRRQPVQPRRAPKELPTW